jgi:hypothetical protein
MGVELKKLNNAYPFHKSNIHERRSAAYICRAFPLGFCLFVFALALYGVFKYQKLLLYMTAFFNVSLWLWVVSTVLLSIYTCSAKLANLEAAPSKSIASPSTVSAACGEAKVNDSYTISDGTGGTIGNDDIKHLIVLPNFQEDENMLKDTLTSFAECEDSSDFLIVLAMEDREGEEGKQKAQRLQSCFSTKFAQLFSFSHPKGLTQCHQDGSEDAEVPGKASNLKYAVEQGYKACEDAGLNLDKVLLTVADADCLFHPLYFSHVARDFKRHGTERTMWQAPQLPYRNYYTAPIVSRVWAYVAAAYEFGGLSSVQHKAFGQHHMIFSSYTMPLQLAHKSEAWDGDVIAEDHHAFLKCFYYSLQEHPAAETEGISLRPVFLPVKSTMVASEGWFQSWIDRWFQAKRHA